MNENEHHEAPSREPQPATPPVEHSSTPASQVVVRPERSPGGKRLFWGLLSGCLLIFILLTIVTTVAAVMGRDSVGAGTRTAFLPGSRVAVLPINGEIMEARETIERLHSYRDNKAVKAIVVRINSPGGAVVPSQEIFEELRKLRAKSGKPIVASMDSIATSGGYYIAVGCDRIVASPGTLTGSIGVIAQWFNVEELVRWAKLDPQTFKSGAMKDAGSPVRDMTELEREYFDQLVVQLHGQFVRAVTAGREGKLTLEQVQSLADGRVYTGEEAHRLKLVDDLGGLHDAISIAGEMAGIPGEPKIIYPRERGPGLLELLLSPPGGEVLKAILQRGRAPFQYRWQ
jgi:protease IV